MYVIEIHVCILKLHVFSCNWLFLSTKLIENDHHYDYCWCFLRTCSCSHASSNKHNVHTHSFLCLIPVDHLPSDEHQILEKTENESMSVDQMSEKLKHIWDICKRKKWFFNLYNLVFWWPSQQLDYLSIYMYLLC